MIVNITKNILINCEIISEYIQRQNYYYASKLIKEMIALLGKFIDESVNDISSEFTNELVSIFKEISLTQEKENYVLLNDVLQFKLVPMMSEAQKCFLSDVQIETGNDAGDTNKKYHVEFTNIGALTLCVKKGEHNIYFHSNGDPYKEARAFAAEYADEDYTDYVILGIGLGYHAVALLEHDTRYRVTVLECDRAILDLALKFNDFSKFIEDNRLEIKFIENVADITACISSESEKFIIHYPSLVVMEESPYKAALKEYFMSMSSIQAHIKELDANFWFNQKLGDASIDVIKDVFEGKTVIYAGGGPSVQKRLNEIIELRNNEKAVFICAGTVYLKLLGLGVVPDYVIITDPLPSLIKQIEGSGRTAASMLYLSTASKEAVENFVGERYVLYQKDYKKSEELAGKNGYTTFETGGSVSTTAVDLALRFNCTKLVCVGLDLGFANNQRHAFGIGGDVSEEVNLLSVEAVDGGVINTSNNLNMYRKWIEKRIAGVKGVELVNMSRGAKIHGMVDK